MRLRKNAKIELIKAVPLFSRCTQNELAVLASEADELTLRANRTLTRQGAPGAASSSSSSRAQQRYERKGDLVSTQRAQTRLAELQDAAAR